MPPPGGYPPQPPTQYIHFLPREAYTPWITRVVAAMLDVLPVLILTAIGLGFAFLTGDNVCVRESTEYGAGMSCSSTWTPTGVIVFTLLDLAVLAFLIWNYGYRQGTTGSSIGKSAMKFKVVSERTWQPIGFGLSIVRQLAHILDTAICYLGYLFPLWDAKRQTFADKIMSTVCVSVTPTG
jgi:uncharacterized RDD family membrane protein YckC